MQYTHRPKFTINTIMLCGIVLLALIIMPQISDSYAQTTANSIVETIYGDTPTTIKFSDHYTTSNPNILVSFRFTSNPSNAVVIESGATCDSTDFCKVTTDEVMFRSANPTHNNIQTIITYHIREDDGVNFPSLASSTVTLNVKEGRATLTPIILQFTADETIQLSFSDFLTTHKTRSSFTMTITYFTPSQFEDVIEITDGTTRSGTSTVFTFIDDVVIFRLKDTTFRDTVEFRIDVSDTTGGTLLSGLPTGNTRVIFQIEDIQPEPDTTDPTTPNVAFSVIQDTIGIIDFGVSDNRYENFDITFRTDGEGVTGNILDHITFDPNTVNGTTSPFGVTAADSLVRFTVAANAALETFAFPYTATDAENNFNEGTVSITFIDADTIAPPTLNIPVFVDIGAPASIDFSGVSDNVDLFEQLTITFDTDDPAATAGILDNISFTGAGLNGTTTPFRVMDTMVPFTAKTEAELGLYSVPYTITDRAGNTANPLGMISFTILTPDTTDPTTPELNFYVNPGRTENFDFSNVTDNRDTDLAITFTVSDTDILRLHGSFNFINLVNQVYTLGTMPQSFFLANDDATLGVYDFQYTATDDADNMSTGTARMHILAQAPPSTPDIIVSVDQGETATFDFSVVVDETDSFEELTIIFNTKDVGATAGILGNGTFLLGTNNTDSNNIIQPFRVTDKIVTFDVNPLAVAGLYIIPYNATDVPDEDGNFEQGTGDILLTIVDITKPVTPLIEVTVIQGQRITLDFGGVTDETNSFSELSIQFTWESSAVSNIGNFTKGVTGDTARTIVSPTIIFEANSDGIVQTHDIRYLVIDLARNIASDGRILLTILAPDITKPVTPDISFSIGLGATGIIDFGVIEDNRYTDFVDLDITFRTSGEDVTGNILEHITFDPNTVNGTTSPFGATNEMVKFTVHDDAALETFVFPYNATDAEGNENTGDISITFIEIDTTNPTAPAIVSTVNQGKQGTIDFSGVTDNDTFEQLVITFDTDDPGATILILRNGTFTSGTNSTDMTPFLVISPMVQFTARSDAMLGDYTIPYTVTDRADNQGTGMITMSILEGIDPTAPPITVTIDQSQTANIDFSGVTDTPDTFDQLEIIFDTDDENATPFILRNGTFIAGLNGTTTPFKVESEIVKFTVNLDAMLGEYTIPYNVTDRAGNFDEDTITMNIVALAPPTTENILVSVDQGETATINFSAVIDEIDTFDELTITIITDDLDATQGLLGNGTFGDGVSGEGPEFTVDDTMVTFDVNLHAFATTYTIPYNATDRAGQKSTGKILMTVNDIIGPIIDQNLTIRVSQGQSVDIDFSKYIIDETTPFERLKIVLDTSSSGILNHGSFTSGVPDGQRFAQIINDQTVTFMANTNAAIFTYNIIYEVRDEAGNGTFFATFTLLIVEPDTTSPITPDIPLSIDQGAPGIIDFGVVDDNRYKDFVDLDITFDTAAESATGGNILEHITFNQNTVNGTTTPFGVTNEMVRFTVHDDAVLETFVFPYTVTDAENNFNAGTVSITFIDADTVSPTTIDIPISVNPSALASIDFSGVSDNIDLFEQLTITFDTDDPAATAGILDNISFTGAGLNGTTTPFKVTDTMVPFTVKSNAEPGLYTVPYTITDRAGNTAEPSGMISFTISEHDTTDPTTPNVAFSISQGTIGIIDFGVTDNRYENFDITFRTDGEGVTGNILDHITFDPNTVNGTTSPFGVNATDGIVRFTVAANAALETFVFPYTATDAENNFNGGTVSITFIEPDTVSPTALDIPVSVNPGVLASIDFSGVSDNVDLFEQLTITFDTDDPAATAGILDNISFTGAGLNGTTTPFKVTDTMVPFTAKTNAEPGLYTVPYTITDRAGNTADPQGMISFTIIGPDTTDPHTPELNFYVNPGRTVNFDFSNVTDNLDTDLSITFTISDTIALGGHGTFEEFDFVLTNSFFTFIREPPSYFQADPGATVDEYTFPYTATDDSNNMSTGTVNMHILARAPPSTPDIIVSVDQGETATFDFSGVIDEIDSFEELTITINTDDVGATAGILGNGTFGTDGVTGDGPSFTIINDQTVTFDVNPLAVAGLYTIPYNATDVPDEDGKFEQGTGKILLTVVDITKPVAPLIEITAPQGQTVDVDFGGVTDETDSFEQLDIRFTLSTDSEQGSFIEDDSLTRTASTHTVLSQIVRFTADPDAPLGNFMFSYTVTDRVGNVAEPQGTISLTIIEHDIEAPIAPDILISINLGARANIDFSEVADNIDLFEQLTITFDTDDPAAILDILGNVTFTGAGLNDTSTPFKVTDTMVPFTVKTEAESGLYRIPYTVTDRAGNTANPQGMISFTIVDITAPITPNIIIKAKQSQSGIINFGVITDDDDSFDQLNIKYATGTHSNFAQIYLSPAHVLTGPASFASAFTVNGDDVTEDLIGITPTKQMVRYTIDESAIPGHYQTPYVAIDSDGKHSLAFIQLEVLSDPSTPNILVTLDQGAEGNLNFGTVTDGTNLFDELIITFDTDDPAATAGILDNIRFTGAGLNGTTTPFRVTDEMVPFDVEPLAVAGVYSFQYTALDLSDLHNTGTVFITIVDVTDPVVSEISITLHPGITSNLDFGGVTDETNSFDELIITFDTDDPAATAGILDNISFTGAGLNGTSTPFKVTDTRVPFTVKTNAEPRSYTVPYTVTDKAGNTADPQGVISFTILTPDTIDPTTPNVAFSVIRGTIGIIDFGVTDNRYENFDITFRTDGEGVTGNILNHITFDPNTVNGTTSPFGVTADERVRFTVAANAALQTFVFPYTATDAEDNFNGGTVSITFIDADTIAPPTLNIPVFVNIGARASIDFSDVSDNVDLFEQLTITFDTDDPAATAGILDNISFTGAGLNDTSTPFKVMDTMAPFTVKTEAEPGLYTVPYTITDRAGNTANPLGMISFTILEPDPNTPNLNFYVNPGRTVDFDFSNATDNVDTDFSITSDFFDTANLRMHGSFESVDFVNSVYTFNTIPQSFFRVSGTATPGIYDFTYTVKDDAGNNSMGTVYVHILPRAPPSTPDIIVSVDQGETAAIDFSVVIDETDSFEQLTITFNTDDVSATAGILGNGTFLLGTNNTDSNNIIQPFRVTDKIVTFDVNLLAVTGLYIIPYTVADAPDLNGKFEQGTGKILMTVEDITKPVTPLIEVTVIQGQRITLDFGGVTDETSSFSELSIQFTWESSAVSNIGNFTKGVTGDTARTLVSPTIIFEANSDGIVQTHEIRYLVRDLARNIASDGRILLTILAPDITKPVTPDITFSIGLGATGVIDFGVIEDNRYTDFVDLDITFDTAAESATGGNILEHITFDQNTVNGTTTPFGVTNEMVKFTVHDDAALETFAFPYNATDAEGNENTGDISITFIEIDTTNPTAPAIVSTVNQGKQGTIDFSSVTDNVDSLDELVITFDTDDPGATILILRNGTFTSGTNSTDMTPFLVISPMVQFTARSDAMIGDYTIPYTVTDRTDNQGTGMITMSILEGIDPTAPPITVTIDQSQTASIDFSGVTDTPDTFDQLEIIFDTDDENATPFILRNGTFIAGLNGTTTPFKVESEIVKFTVNLDAMLGEYTIPYNVTDRAGNFDDGIITMNIVALAPPTTENILVSIDQGETATIDFSMVIDEVDTFEQLTITINTEDDGATLGLLGNGTFGDGVSGEGPEFTVDDTMVTFDVNLHAFATTYTIPYNATDRAGQKSTGKILMTVNDIIGPIIDQNLTIRVSQGQSVDIDFSKYIIDETTPFEKIKIVLDTSSSGILNHGSFTSGVPDGQRFAQIINDQTVTFMANTNAATFTYNIIYEVRDEAGNGTFFATFTLLIVQPDTTSPITPDIPLSVSQGVSDIIDFGVVDDNRYKDFVDLDITFDTAAESATGGNILEHITFNQNTVNGTTTPFGVTNEMVRFTVNANAVLETFVFPYTVTDAENNFNAGTVSITFIEPDTVAPPTLNIPVFADIGAPTSIDFSGVSDNVDLFEQLTITFDTDDPAATAGILDNISFTGAGLNGTTTPFRVMDMMVPFTTKINAEPGLYSVPYTVTDRAGNTAEPSGMISFTILIPDSTDPITSELNFYVNPGRTVNFDFSNVTDNLDTDLSITFTISDTIALGGHGTFENFDFVSTNSFFTFIRDPPSYFQADPGATVDEYTFPYTATDDSNNMSTDTVNMHILARAPPSTPDIIVSVDQGETATIDFSGVIDEIDSFEELTITINTDDVGATAGILGNGTFGIDGVTGDGPSFTIINDQTVTFDVNPLAVAGLYTIPYNATDVPDEDGKFEQGTGRILLTVVDVTAPVTPAISDTTNNNEKAMLDFSTVMDETTLFDELIITFDTDDPNATPGILGNGIFAAGTNSTITPFKVESKTVIFTANSNAEPKLYEIPYTATDRAGQENSGMIQMTINNVVLNPTNKFIILDVLIADDTPNTDDISVTVKQDDDATINFDGNVSDIKDDIATLVISVNTTGTGVSSPGTASADSLLVFNSEDITIDAITNPDGFTVTSTGKTLRVTPDSDADVGDYVLPYRVTDSDGNRSDGTITITVSLGDTPVIDNVDDQTITIHYNSNEPTFTKIFTVDEFTDLINNDENNHDLNNIIIEFASTIHTDHATVTASTGSAITFDASTRTLRYTPAIDGTTPLPFKEIIPYTARTDATSSSTGEFTFSTVTLRCESENLNADNLSFGRSYHGEISNEISFMVKNTGNAPFDLTLGAGPWMDSASTPNLVMNEDATAYAIVSGQDYSSKTQFGIVNGDYTIDDVAVNGMQSIYLQLDVDLINESFTGIISQNIDTMISCS